MENNQINYIGKRGVHVPKDVKEYVLKRVRESGKPVTEIAKEHGIAKSRIYKQASTTNRSWKKRTKSSGKRLRKY